MENYSRKLRHAFWQQRSTKNMNEQNIKSGKSFWGYGIAAVYSIFAVAMISFVAFTMTQKVELVAPDYYTKEIGYEQQIDRERQTNKLTQAMTCQLIQEGKFIKIQFPNKNAAVEGTIKLYRPSDSLLDFSVPVKPDEQGLQSFSTAKMATGAWRVKVSWETDGQEFYQEFLLHLT
jgi:hypothetical protein